MQVDIQIFFIKGIDSPIEIKRIANLDGLLQEISDLEKVSDLRLLINVGRSALNLEEAITILQSTVAEVILTESTFFAMSDYFEIDSNVIQSPYGSCYQSSTHGVVQKIYEKLVSNKAFNKQEELAEATKFGFASDGFSHRHFASGITKTWLKDYISQNPEESKILALTRIEDDISYQFYEGGLSKEFREKLGRHRLNFLYGLTDDKKIENLIPILPGWVHKADISSFLKLDARSQNCLNSRSILKFADLLIYSDDQLLRIPNLGPGTYALIRCKLVEGISSYLESSTSVYGGQSFIENALNYLYINSLDPIDLPKVSSNPFRSVLDLFKDIKNESQGLEKQKHVFENSQITFSTFLECLNFYISNDIKKSKYQTVFTQRIGINAKPLSLQEIGVSLNMTRERVRQIEKKLLTNFSKKFNISDLLESKINNIRVGLSIPLTISSLSSYDAWFSGLESTPWILEAMFSIFKIKSIRVHSFENEFILAPGEYDLIPSSIRAVKDFIKDRLNVGVRRSQILEFTTNLVGVFTPELVHTVFYEATKNATFDLSDGDPIVLAVGSKIVSVLNKLMNASDGPLKCNEIQSQLKQKYAIEVDINYIRNACNTSFYQYAPSTFGLLRHSNLSREEIITVSDNCFDIMLDGGDGRQWHCDQLLNLLLQSDDSFKQKLDKYKLRICLLESDKFIDLGRMVFIIKTEASALGNVKRIEFAQFVEAILQKSPTPMHKDAIYKIIEQDRGLGNCAQIFHTGRLISTEPGIWGLIDKHLDLNDLDFRGIASELVSILRKKQFGLTEAELLSEISVSSKAYRFIENPYTLFSIGIKSKLCRREDVYLALSEWDDCRRPTLKDSIIKSLEKVPPGGMNLKQILDIAEDYYQHPIDRPYANRILLDNNFLYDEQIQVWKRVLD